MLTGFVKGEISRSDLQSWPLSDSIRDEPAIQPLLRT